MVNVNSVFKGLAKMNHQISLLIAGFCSRYQIKTKCIFDILIVKWIVDFKYAVKNKKTKAEKTGKLVPQMSRP